LRLLATEGDRPAEHSVSAFLSDRAIEWLGRQAGPWFAHLSYLRPHPPYAAAGRWASAYDPEEVPMPIAPAAGRHPFHDAVLGLPIAAAPADERELRRLRAQYFGMVSEVDDQLGRVLDTIRALGMWDETVVVVTSDHGEMLGDHGLVQKLGYWEQSYHVVGIVRDPRRTATAGTVVDRFTENVDLLPTICELIGVDVPSQCDGLPLTPLLDGVDPPWWRTAAHWEYDWRDVGIRRGEHRWPWDRVLEEQHLAVCRDETTMYVQFGDGSWRCFDLAADPTCRTEITDAATVLPLAQQMLVWRSRHADRTLADMLTEARGLGRLPPGSPT
jgi:arylsulfatase A-like enzyme